MTKYILLGIAGYLLAQTSYAGIFKRVGFAKPTAWAVGWMVFMLANVALATSPSIVILPEWTRWAGWTLLVLSATLLTLSVFVYLPFRATHIRADATNTLVSTGLYALVRHPWLWGFLLLMLSLILVSRSKSMMIAAPIFALLGIASTAAQDRFLFSRTLPGYENYRRQTPMMIPNAKSVGNFLSSFRRIGQPSRSGGNHDIQLS